MLPRGYRSHPLPFMASTAGTALARLARSIAGAAARVQLDWKMGGRLNPRRSSRPPARACLDAHASAPALLRRYGFAAGWQFAGGCSRVALSKSLLRQAYSAGVPPCHRPLHASGLHCPPWVMNALLSYLIGQVQCASFGLCSSMMHG